MIWSLVSWLADVARLVCAIAAAGLHDANAIAAVFLYRVISLKLLTSLGWLGLHTLAGTRHERKAQADAGSSLRSKLRKVII